MRKRDDIDRLHDEIRDDPPALHVIVELPGVDPASIRVVAADRVLVVAGERCRPPLSGRYQQMELEYGAFQRRISLAEPVDTAAATARYEQGLLVVELPIAKKAPQRARVTISIGGVR